MPDRSSSKAMHTAGRLRDLGIGKQPNEHALRHLIRSNNDISSQDIFMFWESYEGPVEGAEFMYSQGLVELESDVSDGEDFFPPLATALKMYGLRPLQWDGFLRLLLRKGVSLHSSVPRYPDACTYPCGTSDYGTPLDELFALTETPFEGEEAGKRWLEVLSSEGRDVTAYLEEESALRAAQMQFICPSFGK